MKYSMMRNSLSLIVLVLSSVLIQAQEKQVSIPESQLTEQQKQYLTQQQNQQKLNQVSNTIETAHGWVGIGKELGQAFDSALSSLTNRSNEFANTKVGKFTMFIVAWKVMGDQAATVANAGIHFVYGFVEMTVFLPILIWSYRRNCLTRKILISTEGHFWNKKNTWQTIEPKSNVTDYQWIHLLLLLLFATTWLCTVFAY